MVLNGIRKANNLKPILHFELGVDGADVISHRLLCQLEAVGDLLIVKAGGDEPENLLLPVGKGVEPLEAAGDFGDLRAGPVIHGIDQFGGNLGGNLHQPCMKRPDGGNELGGGDVLEQVAGGADAQGFAYILILIVG